MTNKVFVEMDLTSDFLKVYLLGLIKIDKV